MPIFVVMTNKHSSTLPQMTQWTNAIRPYNRNPQKLSENRLKFAIIIIIKNP